MIEKMVYENESHIEKFDIQFYLNEKNYPVASALSALETTNEIQKSYFKKHLDNLEVSDNVLRLYALLQGLFVSVDSLYALAFSLTKSKSFININRNQDLRELKYIRNDVVGHPANRVYNSETLAYCILNNQSITTNEFSYSIYTAEGKNEKKVDILKLLEAYYLECNNLLAELYKVALDKRNGTFLELQIQKTLDAYSLGANYCDDLKVLKKEYKKLYPNAQASQHRVLWRIDLIDEIEKYKTNDSDVEDLKHYCIGLEIVKIYELIYQQSNIASVSKRLPYLISNCYRFFNNNQGLCPHIEKIFDLKNPSFFSSIEQLIDMAKRKKQNGALRYFSLLKSLALQKKDALLYALALPLKEYNRKHKTKTKVKR